MQPSDLETGADPRPVRRIALILPMHFRSGRDIAQGVARYAARSGEVWLFAGSPLFGLGPIDDLNAWNGDGAIIDPGCDGPTAESLPGSVPTVTVQHALPDYAGPRVLHDDDRITSLAIEHLFKSGYPTAAFCGFAGPLHAARQPAAFLNALRGRDSQPPVLMVPDPDGAEAEPEQIRHLFGDWLKSLRAPCGVMCQDDRLAVRLVQICWEIGISVPEQVGIIGVGNQRSVCLLTQPTLSSVQTDGIGIGEQAGAVLHELILGRQTETQEICVPPIGIMGRASTDLTQVDDPLIAKALVMIRQHAVHPLSVTELADRLPLSRRAFERRFLRCMGRTALQEIRRVQIDRVKQMLIETDLPMPEIAKACGLSGGKHLSTTFRQMEGITPSDYRRRFGQ